jgi:ubiquinone/menaquinone biosynthesis C-methylase UbiE
MIALKRYWKRSAPKRQKDTITVYSGRNKAMLGASSARSDVIDKLKEQFSIRSSEFDISANWVKDKRLINAHVDLAGKPSGKALDLCCGTGQIGRALKQKGWDVSGLDICRDMARASARYFPCLEGAAEKIPFRSVSFRLVACRQTFQFLDIKNALSGIARVLAPQGVFIVSLTVPFSDADRNWLYEIHRVKQPLLLKFYTAGGLINELKEAGFSVKESRTLIVRESINRWMDHAPELNPQIREKVMSMVKDAPPEYKKLHRVEVVNGEIFEDWNWVIFKTVFPK